MMALIIRLVVILFIAWALYAVGKRIAKALTSEDKPQIRAEGKMVRCEKCGVYLPKDEASVSDGGFRCDQHRRDD